MLVLALAGGFAATTGAGAQADSGEEQAAVTPPAPDLGPAEAADESEARLLAQAQGRRIEILSERTETGGTWANPDGTLTAEAYAAPVRVKEGGTWRDIDTTLSDTGASLTPEVTGTDIEVSDGGDTRLARVTQGNRSFGLGWEDQLPVPEVRGDTASYALGKDATLTVTALADGFAQNILLDRAPEERVGYRIPVRVDGLRLSRDDSGHLLLKDTGGKLVAEAPAPMMWDSSRDRLSGESGRQAPVDTEIEEGADGQQTLVLTPDPEFLAAADYPVTVDPTSTLAASTDTWVATNYPDSQVSSTELKSGTYDGGTTKARSYLKFDVSALAGKHIVDTDLSLYSTWSSSCAEGSGTQIRRITSAWTSSAVTWAEQPTTTTTGAATNTAAKGYSADCPAGTVGFDVDAIVQSWADGEDNHGVQVRGVDENDSLTWRRYRSANHVSGEDETTEPHLSVTYDSYPGATSGFLPFSGTATSDATPTLRARAGDPDLDELRYTFEVWDAELTARRTTGNTAYLAPGSIASWSSPTLPAGVYKWRARAYDSVNWSKSWSTWRTLTVDPSAPTAPTITSTSHASPGSWYAGKDFTGTLGASDTSAITGYAVKIDQSPLTAAGTEVTQTSTTVSAADRADGTWYVHAAARNAAGLWSTTRHFAFQVDTTAPGTPTVTSSTHPLTTAVYPSRTGTFSWTAPTDGSGAASYAVSVDRSATTLPGTGTVQTGTTFHAAVASDGTWYLHVRARDRAGNWSASAAHFPFQVDASLALRPAVTSTSHPDQSAAYRTTAFTAAWQTTASAAGYSYAVDTSATTVPDTVSDGTTASYGTTKAEGIWYLHVRAVDAAGTWGPTAHYRFTVDTTAPAAPEVGSPDFPDHGWAGDAGDTGGFGLTSTDSGLHALRYRLDDGTETTVTATGPTTTVRLTVADEGSHRLTAVALDKAGNASAAATYTFHVGTAGLVSPLPGEEVGHRVPLAVAGPTDLTGATFQYRRADTDAWTDVPAAEVTDAGGTAVTWPATVSAGSLSGLLWDTGRLTADGDLQVRVRFEGSDSPAPSEPVTVTLNRVDVLTEPVALDTLAEPDTVESYALEVAEERAEAAPDTFAPPYLDQDTDRIVLPVTDSAAKPDATAAVTLTGIPVTLGSDDGSAEGDPDTDTDAPTGEDGIADEVATQDRTVTPVTEEVDHSQAELQSIVDEVLLLPDTEVPGASQLVTASVDAEANRVVVELPEPDDAVADALGERYGTGTVAVRVAPEVAALRTSAGRYTDVSPFKGGAAYEPVRVSSNGSVSDGWRCTTAFPWTHQGHPYMLSAGHCTTGNGYMDSWNPGVTFAFVAYDNWNNSKGSVKVAGKSYYSGDLVTGEVIENKYGVSARIYKGGPNGTSTRRIQDRWTTRSKVGQKFCAGGSTTGEICGWKVTSGKLTIEYSDGTIIKNATRGKKSSGTCDYPGDSGGPVYTVLSNGHIYAKGVISGGLCSGWGIGSDGDDDGWNDDKDCSDATDYDCEIIFTDIKLAEDALPGIVKKW